MAKALFFWGGGIWGVPLDSHEIRNKLVLFSVEEIWRVTRWNGLIMEFANSLYLRCNFIEP